jgi:hypothetical protein
MSDALPGWPILMTQEMGATYTSLGRRHFLKLMADAGVKPVRLGQRIQGLWRRADIDSVIAGLRDAPYSQLTMTEAAREAAESAMAEDAIARAEARAEARAAKRRSGRNLKIG